MKPQLKEYNIYKEMLGNIDVGVYFVDNERKITFWNKGAQEISGFSEDEMMGQHCYNNKLNHIDDNGTRLCLMGCPLHQTIQDGIKRNVQVYLHHKQGHRVKIKIKTIPIYDEVDKNKIVGAVEIFEQVKENNLKKETVFFEENENNIENLKILALYDQLTGLPNRRYLDTILNSKISEYKLLDIPFGIIFMDIDDFRFFNNNYGHDMGDRVLKVVANSLISVIDKQDFVARYGGEEFVCIINMVDKIKLAQISEKIRVFIENSIIREKDNREYKVTVSVGATIVDKCDDMNTVLKRADEQMYLSKQKGKNSVHII